MFRFSFLFSCLTTTVCLSAAAAGTGLSWTSPVKDQLEIKNLTISTNFTNSTHFTIPAVDSVISAPNATIQASVSEFTWIASLLAIGAIVGAVPSGILADKIGRKKAAILITIPYIISWLMTVFAKNIPMLYAARFLIGKCD